MSLTIHVITMVRNEADIWQGFLQASGKLFDRTIVIDHQSVDGTREMTLEAQSRGQPIDLFDYRFRGYNQSDISNALARRSVAEGADWVFFLDADEFLGVECREELQDKLSRAGSDVIFLRWCNLIPTKFGTFEEFELGQNYYTGQIRSQYGKIAFASTFAMMNPQFNIQMGNHGLSTSTSVPTEAHELGPILHLPIRSLDRLRLKIASGVASYEAKRSRNPVEGYHWFELKKLLQAGSAPPALLAGIIAQYGEPLSQAQAIESWPEISCTREIPNVSNEKTIAPLSLKDVCERERSVVWQESKVIDGARVNVRTEASDIRFYPQPIQATGDLGPSVFGPLLAESPLSDLVVEVPDFLQLAEHLQASFDPVQTLVPSAWSRHVPFLFGLVSLLRPRRYVEIGTQYGQSMFAACQAVEQHKLKCQCVAIDSWEGDIHTGFYNKDVFDQFTELLKERHPETGFYIRAYFDEAVKCFADGSIDLLHIDGLHTYEAVKRDFSTWLPKMSSRGVIIMHDTTVHDTDFGVWRLWEELKNQYPALNIMHTHGLGVLYVGNEPTPFGTLLKSLQGANDVAIFINYLFRGIGQTSIARSEAVQRVPHLEAELGRVNAALVALRQALEGERADKAALRQALEGERADKVALRQALEEERAERRQREALCAWNIANGQKRTAEAKRQSSLVSYFERQRDGISYQIARMTRNCNEAFGILERQLGRDGTEVLYGRSYSTLDRSALGEIIGSPFWRDVVLPLEGKINSPGLFDAKYYLSKNSDVRDHNFPPLRHYVLFGAGEGRNPHPLFNTSWYLARYPDVASSGQNPLFHFANWGGTERRSPHALFDTDRYVAQNPDATADGATPLVHYLTKGGSHSP